MSLIAVPPNPASPPAAQVQIQISANGWYPAIDLNQLRDALRLGEVVTHPRLVETVRGAVLHCIDELAAWQADQEAAGFASLAAVAPSPTVDNTPRLVHLWHRAVRFTAGAELAELHRDLSATNEGSARADAQLLTAADYRRLATHALRDMLGTTRTAVELI